MVFFIKKLIGVFCICVGIFYFKKVYERKSSALSSRGYVPAVALIVVGVLIIFGVLKLTD